MTFEQHVIATYGKSVYQIRLEVAIGWQAHQTGYTRGTAITARQMADEFIEAMRARWEREK
jgi:hypothetical protein